MIIYLFKCHLKRVFSYIALSVMIIHASVSFAKSSPPQTVLVIHSYSKDFEWTSGQHNGILQAFSESELNPNEWKITAVYMDGKRIQDQPEKLNHVVKNIEKQILELNPKAVIITDDLAFSKFYRLLREKKIWVAFSGINAEIEKYGYTLRDKGITGTLERYNYTALIHIIQRINPQIKKVAFIGDVSISMDGEKETLAKLFQSEEYKALGLKATTLFQTKSLDEFKNYVMSINPNDTAGVFLSLYTLRDSVGNHVHYEAIDEWLRESTHLMDTGIVSFQVRHGGRLLALAATDHEIGYYAASQIFKAIKNKTDPSELPIRKYLPLKLVINFKRQKYLNLSIPFEILSYVHNIEDLYEIKPVK